MLVIIKDQKIIIPILYLSKVKSAPPSKKRKETGKQIAFLRETHSSQNVVHIIAGKDHFIFLVLHVYTRIFLSYFFVAFVFVFVLLLLDILLQKILKRKS